MLHSLCIPVSHYCSSGNTGVKKILPISSKSKWDTRQTMVHKWLLTSHHITGFPAFSAQSNQFITAGASTDLSVLQSQSTQSNSHLCKHTAAEKKTTVRCEAPRWASKLPGPFSTELFHQARLSVSWGKTSVTHQLTASHKTDRFALVHEDSQQITAVRERPFISDLSAFHESRKMDCF